MDKPDGILPAIDPELLENAARMGLAIEGLSERGLRLKLQKLDPAGAEGRTVESLAEREDDIRRSLDRLFSGF